MLCFGDLLGDVAHFVGVEAEFGIRRIQFAGAELTAYLHDLRNWLTYKSVHYREQQEPSAHAYRDENCRRNNNGFEKLRVSLRSGVTREVRADHLTVKISHGSVVNVVVLTVYRRFTDICAAVLNHVPDAAVHLGACVAYSGAVHESGAVTGVAAEYGKLRTGFFLYVVNVSEVVEVGADYQSAVLHRAAVYGVQLVAVRHYALHSACLYPCDCVVAEREVFGAPDCLTTVYVRCEACFRGLVGRPGIVVVRIVYLSP